MNSAKKYLQMCNDQEPKRNKVRVEVIDHETYRLPSGQILTSSSRPTEPAPDGRFDSPEYGWHDVLCKWVKLEDIDKPCVAEV